MNCIDDWKNLNIINQCLFYKRWGSSAMYHNGNIIIYGGFGDGIKYLKISILRNNSFFFPYNKLIFFIKNYHIL